MAEPIDYEAAVRELLRRRRRRRWFDWIRTLPDPRPTTPGQVVLAGLVLILAGWLIHPLHLFLSAGAIMLIVGFFSGFIQPRGRTVVWRNRTIDLPPEPRWTDRLYAAIYRRRP